MQTDDEFYSIPGSAQPLSQPTILSSLREEIQSSPVVKDANAEDSSSSSVEDEDASGEGEDEDEDEDGEDEEDSESNAPLIQGSSSVVASQSIPPLETSKKSEDSGNTPSSSLPSTQPAKPLLPAESEQPSPLPTPASSTPSEDAGATLSNTASTASGDPPDRFCCIKGCDRPHASHTYTEIAGELKEGTTSLKMCRAHYIHGLGTCCIKGCSNKACNRNWNRKTSKDLFPLKEEFADVKKKKVCMEHWTKIAEHLASEETSSGKGKRKRKRKSRDSKKKSSSKKSSHRKKKSKGDGLKEEMLAFVDSEFARGGVALESSSSTSSTEDASDSGEESDDFVSTPMNITPLKKADISPPKENNNSHSNNSNSKKKETAKKSRSRKRKSPEEKTSSSASTKRRRTEKGSVTTNTTVVAPQNNHVQASVDGGEKKKVVEEPEILTQEDAISQKGKKGVAVQVVGVVGNNEKGKGGGEEMDKLWREVVELRKEVREQNAEMKALLTSTLAAIKAEQEQRRVSEEGRKRKRKKSSGDSKKKSAKKSK